MKWMEMVRVRSSSQGVEKLGRDLPELLEAVRGAGGLSFSFVLSHALYEGDMAIVLLWENERQPVRTREGLMLANHLATFGSVDHEVWRASLDATLGCDGVSGGKGGAA